MATGLPPILAGFAGLEGIANPKGERASWFGSSRGCEFLPELLGDGVSFECGTGTGASDEVGGVSSTPQQYEDVKNSGRICPGTAPHMCAPTCRTDSFCSNPGKVAFVVDHDMVRAWGYPAWISEQGNMGSDDFGFWGEPRQEAIVAVRTGQ
jgi:hypothetical protein